MGDRPFRFGVTAIFALALLGIPAWARPAQQNQQNAAKKVWTNEDVQRLKDRDAISIIGIGPDEFDVDEPPPAAQGAKQKVLTNDDLERLRNQDNLSIVPLTQPAEPAPPAPPAAAPPAAGAPPTAPAGAAPCCAAPYAPSAYAAYDPFGDPNWYAQQAYTLRQQLEERNYELDRYAEGIALAKDRITQPGVNFSSWGYVWEEWITPQAGLEDLRTRVGEAEIELDNLRNLARKNGIAPGVLGD